MPQTTYLPLRKVFAVGIGNALDFYDFLTYSFFAVQIGHCFFPQGKNSHSLLLSLATFGVGYLTRPLGGIVLGLYADRAGRTKAMLLSFSMMGFGITALALTPGYQQIGMAAPILLVIFRLIQGFALGGQVGPSTAYLIEAAPPLKRGLYVALQYATQDFAVLCAGIIGFTLSALLSAAQLDAWGWRLAFLLGASIVPLGIYMRRRLPETLNVEEEATEPAPQAAPSKVPLKAAMFGIAMVGSGTIGSYVLDYMTTFAQDSVHLSANLAFGATIILGGSSVVTDIIAGLLSDKFGRKPVMLSAVSFAILLTVPAYYAMLHWPSAGMVYLATAVLSILLALTSGPCLVSLSELLPKTVRSTGLGTIYAISVALLGGSTQFMIKFLSEITSNPMAPAWYLTGALVVGATAMWRVRETAPAKTDWHCDLATEILEVGS